MKTCSTCKVEKSIEEFHKKAKRCKPCAIAASRLWASQNPERRREIGRSYYHRNPNKYRVNQQQWKKDNPEHAKFLSRVGSHVRRARIRGSSGTYTKTEWDALLMQYDYKCLCCGHEHKETRWERLTADHVIPISKGGSNTIDNIQPLCYHCNYVKHSKIIDYRSTFARNIA